MHPVKSVTSGTEQCWASRTKVNEHMEFSELRASQVGVAYVVPCRFELECPRRDDTTSKQSHLG